MDKKGGLDKLRTCLFEMDETVRIEDLLLYKYGTKKHTSEYSSASIAADFSSEEIKYEHNLPVVVKCFIHPEIYAAWHSSVGIGRGKYYVSKSDLEEFERHSEIDYKESVIGNSDLDKVYIFRNNSGIKKFFTNVCKIKEQDKSK